MTTAAYGVTRQKSTWKTVNSLLLLLCSACAGATPPILLSQPAYQSPVRGDPGDLLMLAGDGFATTNTVVYRAITDTTRPQDPPTSTPTTSDAASGVTPLASTLDVPHSLTVTLPPVMQTDQSYMLWVQDTSGAWSNGVKINDARPLWISPDSAYVSAPKANLPRYLKVVGRNLQPAPGATTQVQLSGPNSYTLTATNHGYPGNALDRYVAQVTLPTNMTPGVYTVQVSRDGVSWVGVASGQTLAIAPDPVAPPTFQVSDPAYGGCAPNDGLDDTPCIVRAIAAARAAGGGSVVFGSGVWDMSNDTQTGVVYFGVLVPVGVDLIGVDASSTTVQRDTTWNMQKPIFTLQGRNTVQGITFKDAYVYKPSDQGRMLLGLGVAPVNAQSYNSADPSVLSDVTITENVFVQPFVAIQDGGMPIDHLFVTNNTFGAYDMGLYLDSTHYVSDSVVAYNTFEPGSYINVATGQGALSTSTSAGQRLDFSNNVADGTSTRYLYSPATDAKGFRAAFFWSLLGDHAQVLVSQNTVLCSGDKDGDGEAIAFDGNSNVSALAIAQPVLAATANSVTVQGPLLTLSKGTAYTELWIQISKGTGVGQVRPVIAYSNTPGQPATFAVSPAWDVVPGPDSMVTTAKEYWQLYTVDNYVDQRQPECQKSNANQPSGGEIGIWAGSSDSAIEGNQQYDTGGIQYNLAYRVQSAQFGTSPVTGYQTFLDIRNNAVEGEYAWGASCSYSGIRGWYGASPDAPAGPPIESYGVSISHNTVTQADDLNGGAIALSRSWYAGPPPGTWQYAENTLIFRNSINNITNPPAGPATAYSSCSATYPRLGMHFDDALAWHTVLYGNSCSNVAQNLSDQGTATLRVCAPGATNSCECAAYAQGAEASATASSVAASFPQTQVAGDLNVVAVSWPGAAQVTAVTDSSGNTYTLAGTPISSPDGGITQAVYYANNINAAATNTVTVTFSAPLQGSIRLAEYQGLDPVKPIDAAAGSSGTGSLADSGWVTTNSPNDLLIGIGLTGGAAVMAGTGYTAEQVNGGAALGQGLIEDRFVTATAAYHATAQTAPSSWWVMQMMALPLAGGGGSNTQALTAPVGLAATVASANEIDLSWTGSTDNTGVTAYLIERCPGNGCQNFAQIISVPATTTTYSDSNLAPATTYRYRVRASDVATLESAYSATATATTAAQ